MKIEKCFGKKVKFGKFSTESENLSEAGGNQKQRGKVHHCLRGMDAPARCATEVNQYARLGMDETRVPRVSVLRALIHSSTCLRAGV